MTIRIESTEMKTSRVNISCVTFRHQIRQRLSHEGSSKRFRTSLKAKIPEIEKSLAAPVTFHRVHKQKTPSTQQHEAPTSGGSECQAPESPSCCPDVHAGDEPTSRKRKRHAHLHRAHAAAPDTHFPHLYARHICASFSISSHKVGSARLRQMISSLCAVALMQQFLLAGLEKQSGNKPGIRCSTGT